MEEVSLGVAPIVGCAQGDGKHNNGSQEIQDSGAGKVLVQ